MKERQEKLKKLMTSLSHRENHVWAVEMLLHYLHKLKNLFIDKFFFFFSLLLLFVRRLMEIMFKLNWEIFFCKANHKSIKISSDDK